MSYIITFHSVSDALVAKKKLESLGGSGSVVPTPRALSSSCGYALDADDASKLALKEALSEFDVGFGEIYLAARVGRNVTYSQIHDVDSI